MARIERMKSYLPEHFAESREIKAILEDGNERFEEVTKVMDDVLNQFFVETATWGISKWEEELEILPSEPNIGTRRNRIISKLTSQTPTNYRTIENEVNRFLQSPTSVVRLIDKEYAFEIIIPAADLYKPKKDITDAVEEIKPAHLRLEIVAEIVIEIIQVVDDTYSYPVFYKTCGEFSGEKDFTQFDIGEINLIDNIYSYPVEYPVSEKGFSQLDAEPIQALDDTYGYIKKYPVTGDMEPLFKAVTVKEMASEVNGDIYNIGVSYPICGEFHAEGDD